MFLKVVSVIVDDYGSIVNVLDYLRTCPHGDKNSLVFHKQGIVSRNVCPHETTENAVVQFCQKYSYIRRSTLTENLFRPVCCSVTLPQKYTKNREDVEHVHKPGDIQYLMLVFITHS